MCLCCWKHDELNWIFFAINLSGSAVPCKRKNRDATARFRVLRFSPVNAFFLNETTFSHFEMCYFLMLAVCLLVICNLSKQG